MGTIKDPDIGVPQKIVVKYELDTVGHFMEGKITVQPESMGGALTASRLLMMGLCQAVANTLRDGETWNDAKGIMLELLGSMPDPGASLQSVPDEEDQ